MRHLCYTVLFLLFSATTVAPAFAQQEVEASEDTVEEPPRRRPSSAPT